MGRWAQSRRRGRCNPPPRAFPLDPPDDELWQLNSDGFTEAVGILVSGTCVAGADGFDMVAMVNPMIDPNILSPTNAPCAGPAVNGGFGPTDYVDAQIRWTLGGLAVSDWSQIKSVFIS